MGVGRDMRSDHISRVIQDDTGILGQLIARDNVVQFEMTKMTLDIKTSRELQDIFDKICFCTSCNNPEAQKRWISAESEIEWLESLLEDKNIKINQKDFFRIITHIEELKGVKDEKQ